MSDLAVPEKERWIDRPGVRKLLGRVLIGNYLRFLRMTSRVVADPPDFWESAHKDWPAIAVSWHGQSNLAYVVMPDPRQVALLISMHPDGQMMGAMAQSLGYQTVDGSGASSRQKQGTGGLAAEGQTIIIVEQNIAAALSIASRAYILNNGHVVFDGTSTDLRASPEILARYVGV